MELSDHVAERAEEFAPVIPIPGRFKVEMLRTICLIARRARDSEAVASTRDRDTAGYLKRPDQKKDAGTPRRRRIHSQRSDF